MRARRKFYRFERESRAIKIFAKEKERIKDILRFTGNLHVLAKHQIYQMGTQYKLIFFERSRNIWRDFPRTFLKPGEDIFIYEYNQIDWMTKDSIFMIEAQDVLLWSFIARREYDTLKESLWESIQILDELADIVFDRNHDTMKEKMKSCLTENYLDQIKAVKMNEDLNFHLKMVCKMID